MNTSAEPVHELFDKEDSASECSEENTSEQDLEDAELEDNCDYNDEQEDETENALPKEHAPEVPDEDGVIRKTRRITTSSIMKSLSSATYVITEPSEEKCLITEEYLIEK